MAETVEQLGVDLERAGREIPRDLRPRILRTCANYQLREVRQNYRREQFPGGASWPALSPATRRNRKHSRRMLWSSIDVTHKMRAVDVDANTVAVGTNDAILAIHHSGATMTITRKQSVWMFYNLFGGTGPPGPFGMAGKLLRIPSRTGIGFGPADAAAHEEIVGRHVERALQK